MKSDKKTKLTFAVLLVAGVCCPAVSRLWPFAPAAGVAEWIWLYVFLHAACRCRSRKQWAAAAIAFLAGWFVSFGGALGDSILGIIVLAASGLLTFVGFGLAARAMTRWNRFYMTLAFPLAWLALYGIMTVLRFPSIARVDMIFAEMPVLLQVERWIGAAGLCFGIVWSVSICRFAVANRKMGCAGVATGLLLALMAPGIVALYPNEEPVETLRVAYTTGPYIGDFMNYTDLSYDENAQSLARSVSAAAEQNAEILVFSEEAFTVQDTEEEHFLSYASGLAEEKGIALLLGLDVVDTDGSEGGRNANKAVLIDAEGAVAGTYQKSHLVPLVESGYAPGDGGIPSYTLETGGKSIRISWLICYDSNFVSYVGRMDPDTDILFLPSWDWEAVTDLHAKLCCTLAVQNMVNILKPTYDGLSVAVDTDGRIYYSSSTDVTGYEQVQVVEMPIRSAGTASVHFSSLSPLTYAVIGTELFSALICILLLVVTRVKDHGEMKRTRWYTAAVTANLLGCCADAVSWLLDGSERLIAAQFVLTLISLEMTLVVISMFSSYLTEYISERKQVSHRPAVVTWVCVLIAMVMTACCAVMGQLFTFVNGSYVEGPLYTVYVITNASLMVIGVGVVFVHFRALSPTDRVISYVYLLLPALMALINIWVEDWSFAYPAVTFSMVLVHAMMQSDQLERMEHREQIVSFHASHDELTGLLNRRAFNAGAEALRLTEGNSGVVFGDVNGLKYTNDHLGHEEGDRLLLRYVDVLSGVFRAGDLYRISGDEFVCLMQNVPQSAFEDHVHELQIVLQRDRPPLASIGAAYGSNADILALLHEAEEKMYVEKEEAHRLYPEMRR